MHKCKEALSNEQETRMQAHCDTALHHPLVLVHQEHVHHVLADVVTAQYAGILPQMSPDLLLMSKRSL